MKREEEGPAMYSFVVLARRLEFGSLQEAFRAARPGEQVYVRLNANGSLFPVERP